MTYTNISAVILSGGRNTRMEGRDKAMLSVAGQPILERSISVLEQIFEELIIVTNDTRTYNYKGIKIVKDEIKNIGPLGGIHAGLGYLSGKAGFFVGCDMPFLHNDIIRQQVEHFNRTPCDALVPRIGGSIEPLHAVYKTSLKDKINNFVKKSDDHSIRSFLKTTNVHFFDLQDTASNRQCFRNINTPEDLKKDIRLQISDVSLKK